MKLKEGLRITKRLLFLGIFIMGCDSRYEVTSYFETGEVKSRVYSADTTGGISGEYVEYSKLGDKKMKGRLYNGKRIGEWTYYHPDGSIKARGIYVDGLKNGEWVYNPLGNSYQIEWKVYTDSNLFKINIPNDWIIEQAPGLHLIGRKPVVNETEFGSNFNVSSTGSEQIPGDLQTIAKNTISQTIEEYKGLSPSILSHDKTIINNNKAEIYSVHFEGNGVLSISYFIEGEDEIYYLNFFTKIPEKDTLLLREIAFSFNVI